MCQNLSKHGVGNGVAICKRSSHIHKYSTTPDSISNVPLFISNNPGWISGDCVLCQYKSGEASRKGEESRVKLTPSLDFYGFKFLLLDRLSKALVQLFFVR